jgi:hypothetical protein
MLSEGVKVYFSEGINPSEKLSISEGVELMESEDYFPESYVPKYPFRNITSSELDVLKGDGYSELFLENLAILKLSENFKTIIHKMNLKDVNTQTELHKVIQNQPDLAIELNNELNDFFEPYLTSIRHKKVFGIFFVPPNVRTVGRQESTKKHMGLHIDSSTKLPISEYSNAPNRVCINIGSCTRHLLVINKTVKQLLEMIAKKTDISFIKTQDDVSKSFFRYYPTYPVTKIAINPFEAYIAPTDNVIHDGTTVGMTSPDLTIVLFGFFNLRPNTCAHVS